MSLPQSFKAMVVTETADKKFLREVTRKSLADLPAGELLIEVKYSSGSRFSRMFNGSPAAGLEQDRPRMETGKSRPLVL